MTTPKYCLTCSEPISEEWFRIGGGGAFTSNLRQLFFCMNLNCPRYALASLNYSPEKMPNQQLTDGQLNENN